jgi:hypothetical protein
MEMNNRGLTVEGLQRVLAQLILENRGSEPVQAWLNVDDWAWEIGSVDDSIEGCVQLNLIDPRIKTFEVLVKRVVMQKVLVDAISADEARAQWHHVAEPTDEQGEVSSMVFSVKEQGK